MIYMGKKNTWVHSYFNDCVPLKTGMINSRNTANDTKLWTTGACLRARGQNTQHDQIPSTYGDSKGYLSRKDARGIKQKSKVRHY